MHPTSQRHKTHRLKATAVFLGIVFLLGTACSDSQRSVATSPDSFRQVTDEAGKTMRVPARIDRFISLAPNLTEIVYAIGAGDRLVGNTTFCDYPPEAKRIAKVGDTLHPNLEKIIALRPQLVLVSTASQLEAFTKELDDHQIAVYVTDPHDLAAVLRSIQNLGDLLNETDKAEAIVSRLQQRSDAVQSAVKNTKPVSVFYQLSAEPLYTAGHDSFVTDLIHLAGGTSVTANVPGAWPKYSGESALAAAPEVIILPTGGAMGSANSSVAGVLSRSPAVKNGRVYRINDDYLSRPGPRSIDGLEEIARALHPEVFNK